MATVSPPRSPSVSERKAPGGVALVLGGGAALPLSTGTHTMIGGFGVEELERRDFDAAQFVSAARRSVPLDQLCGSLAGHLAELRASLIDAINRDYAAFVGMASSLRGLDKAVSKVCGRTPIHAATRPFDGDGCCLTAIHCMPW